MRDVHACTTAHELTSTPVSIEFVCGTIRVHMYIQLRLEDIYEEALYIRHHNVMHAATDVSTKIKKFCGLPLQLGR